MICLKKYRKTIPVHRRSEYTGAQAPRTPISLPEGGWTASNSENHFFCVLEFSPMNIEVLQLRREGHLRVMFSKDKDWKGLGWSLNFGVILLSRKSSHQLLNRNCRNRRRFKIFKISGYDIIHVSNLLCSADLNRIFKVLVI
jgi:hypothetical protein